MSANMGENIFRLMFFVCNNLITGPKRSATQVEGPACQEEDAGDNVTEPMDSTEPSRSHEGSQPGPEEYAAKDVAKSNQNKGAPSSLVDVLSEVTEEMRELPVVAESFPVSEKVDKSDDNDWKPRTCTGVPNQLPGVRADTWPRPVGRGRSFTQWAETIPPKPFTTSQTSKFIVQPNDLPLSTQPSPPSPLQNPALEVPAEAKVQDSSLTSPTPVTAAEAPVQDGPMTSPTQSLLQRPQYRMEIWCPQLQTTPK